MKCTRSHLYYINIVQYVYIALTIQICILYILLLHIHLRATRAPSKRVNVMPRQLQRAWQFRRRLYGLTGRTFQTPHHAHLDKPVTVRCAAVRPARRPAPRKRSPLRRRSHSSTSTPCRACSPAANGGGFV